MKRLAGLALAALLGCRAVAGDTNLGSTVEPVPPVRRLPVDVEGAAVLVAEDAAIESRDPEIVGRATDHGVQRQLRAEMERALALAGFRVVTSPEAPHDLVARLALAVSEDGGEVRQVYRCGLRAPGGGPVAQVDWAWPAGVSVAQGDVFAFASHSLASEVAGSRAVAAHLRARRGP